MTHGLDTATLTHTAVLLTVLQTSPAVSRHVLVTEVVIALTGSHEHLQAISFQLTITVTKFILETVYQILSESLEFSKRYF